MISVLRALFVSLSIVSASQAAEPDAPTGLNLEVFEAANPLRPVERRVDPNIDYHWGDARPGKIPQGQTFRARWSGWIKAPLKGQYNFVVQSDDAVQLAIDDIVLINEPKLRAGSKSVALEMTGEPQKIQVDYHEGDMGAWITVRWNRVGFGTPQTIPTEVLFPTKESAEEKRPAKPIYRTGLVAEYFDTRFKKRLGVERVHRTEAIWADEPPMPGLPYDAGARYSGFLVPPTTGRYQFKGFGDDHLRVAIDGKPLLETSGKTTSAIMELEGGKAYPIQIEYVDASWWGSYFLHWTPPGESDEQSIPFECLFPTRQMLPKKSK